LGNFYGNRARKTVYLPDIKKTLHGLDQIPVLRRISAQKNPGSGGTAKYDWYSRAGKSKNRVIDSF
jgi:hypothetical protein